MSNLLKIGIESGSTGKICSVAVEDENLIFFCWFFMTQNLWEEMKKIVALFRISSPIFFSELLSCKKQFGGPSTIIEVHEAIHVGFI